MADLTALLGLHVNPVVAKLIHRVFQKHNYAVTTTTTPEEMYRLAQEKQYFCYYMALNLGTAQGTDVTPAVRVYELVRERVEKGDAFFMGIAGLLDTVDAGLEKGIPSALKPHSVLNWLKEITPAPEA